MNYPAHATKKSFRIFLGISVVALAGLLIPLYIFGGSLPRIEVTSLPSTPFTSPSPKKPASDNSSAETKSSAKAKSAPVAVENPPAPKSAVYTVDTYDPSRDPAKDLEETLERARAENKHVLVVVGGAWCLWSRSLDVFIRENEETAAALGSDYLIMKVNYSQANENRIFIESLEEITAIPHFFILDSEGELLASQITAPLEKGPAYDTGAVLAFLSDWTPSAEPSDASTENAESDE